MLDPRRQVGEMLLKNNISLLYIILGPVLLLEPESNWNVQEPPSPVYPRIPCSSNWVPQSPVSASPQNLLEMQNLGFYPHLLEQNPNVTQIPGCSYMY